MSNHDFNKGFNSGKTLFNKLSNLSRYEPLFWGDCMKLAISLRVNIFWLRVFFIAASMFYGIGIIAYLLIHFRPQTIADVSSAMQNLKKNDGNKLDDNQKKGLAFIVFGFLSIWIIPFALRTLRFYMAAYYLREYYLIYVIAIAIVWQGIKRLRSDGVGSIISDSLLETKPVDETKDEGNVISSDRQNLDFESSPSGEQSSAEQLNQNINNLTSHLNFNKMKVTISIDQQAKSTMFGLGATKHSYKLNVSFKLSEKERKIFNDHPLLQEMRFMDYMQGKKRDIPLSITAKDIYMGKLITMDAQSVNEMIEFRNEVVSAAEKFVNYIDILSDILGGRELTYGE